MDKNKVVLFDIDYTLFDTAFFKESKLLEHKIYQEIISVLDSLKKIAVLGIFSEGDVAFQIEKIKQTNIDKYFARENTHIVSDKYLDIKGILEKYRGSKIFFVDDKLGILHAAKKNMPEVFTVWVKRGPFAKAQEPITEFNPDATVDNLQDIVKIINP